MATKSLNKNETNLTCFFLEVFWRQSSHGTLSIISCVVSSLFALAAVLGNGGTQTTSRLNGSVTFNIRPPWVLNSLCIPAQYFSKRLLCQTRMAKINETVLVDQRFRNFKEVRFYFRHSVQSLLKEVQSKTYTLDVCFKSFK